MTISLGTNDFFGVPFPLVLADRFFHLYSTASDFRLDIFRWDEQAEKPIYEVKESEPLIDNINTNPTGIVTFTEPVSGSFLYKFRPKAGISQIFGKVPVNKEFEVRINDHEIVVMSDDREVCTLRKNMFVGVPIGIQVGADRSIAIGVNRIPNGMKLIRRT
jgi:hypothetical protein